jgi:hypothetical protein
VPPRVTAIAVAIATSTGSTKASGVWKRYEILI